MTKHEAIKLFGSGAALGRAIGLTRQRISQIPEGPLPQMYEDRITGAAIRLGKVKCGKKITPPCFNSAREYKAWLQAAESFQLSLSEHCTDCTPEYKQKMIEQQRCEWPATIFEPDSDGWLRGYRRRSEGDAVQVDILPGGD